MKKLILSLVFVLATGTSFMNANDSGKEDKVTLSKSYEEIPASCLLIAYN